MADRTIGELKPVPIGDLPLAPDIYDDTLIPVEQQGKPRHISGRQWTLYAKAAAAADVKRAVDAADAAQKSQTAAAESAKDAADVALHPPILKDGSDHWWIWDTELNDYKDSGIDAGVSLEVSQDTVTGEPGTPAKVENLGTATDPLLRFTLPQGTPGVSPTVTVTKEGGTATVTITDAEGPHTAEIHDGDVSRETLDAELAKKQDALTFDDAPTEGSGNPVKSGGVYDALQRKPNRNLLHNWYFANPVNRNGKTKYNENRSYTIDRWQLSEDESTLTVEDGYITIDGPHTWNLYQPLEDRLRGALKGQIVTLSCLTSEELVSVTADNAYVEDVSKTGKNLFIWINSGGVVIGRVNVQEPAHLIAAKLELGDTQTLAHKDENGAWVLNEIPDYAEQYAICEQYSPITGEFVGSQHSNENMLDNTYFVGGGSQQGNGSFPINQRGQEEYTGPGYTIDRIFAENGTVTVTDNGVTFSGGVFSQRADKRLSEELRGRTATISGLTSSGELYSATGKLGGSMQADFPGGGYISCMYYTNEAQFLRIYAPNTVTLIAAKLELGPVQTLAHKEGDMWVLNDPPPDYGEELRKCQAYQRELISQFDDTYANIGIGIGRDDTHTYVFIPLDFTFAKRPILKYAGEFYLVSNDASFIRPQWHVTAMSIIRVSGNGVTLQVVTESTVDASTPVFLVSASKNASLFIDAN